MFHDEAQHDVIRGHQVYIHRKNIYVYLFIGHRICIWLESRAVHVMRARFARDEIFRKQTDI